MWRGLPCSERGGHLADAGQCCSLQALYDHLMDFLADRGVDNTFADELVELSTALEHQEYITFLEDLKSFVKSQ